MEREELQEIPLYRALGPYEALPGLDSALPDIVAQYVLEVWVAGMPDGTVGLVVKRVGLFRDETPDVLVNAHAAGPFPPSDPMLGPGLHARISCTAKATATLGPSAVPGIVLDVCEDRYTFAYSGGADRWLEVWAKRHADRNCPREEACETFLRSCDESDLVFAVQLAQGSDESFQIVAPLASAGKAIYHSQACPGSRLPGLMPL